MIKRLTVIILFFPALFLWIVWAPIEYLKTGQVNPNETPMDKLIRWAK